MIAIELYMYSVNTLKISHLIRTDNGRDLRKLVAEKRKL